LLWLFGQSRNPEPVDFPQHGPDILMAAAEMTVRIRQRMRVDAVQPVTFVVNQAVVADRRPQHQAEHTLVMPRQRVATVKNTVASVNKLPKPDIRTA
jgi:hypothetical protein